MSFTNYLNKMANHTQSINSKLSFWQTTKQKGSKGETITRNFLKKYHIPHKEQKTFNGLYYKNKECPLRFDFQIWTDENKWILLEIDGLQHFKPSSFGGHLTEQEIQKNFEEGQKRDNLKNKYCEIHNIVLERIIWDGNKDKLIKNLILMMKKYKNSSYKFNNDNSTL